MPTLLDLLVVLPNGQELAVFPTIALDVIPFPLQLNGIWLPMPVVPATAALADSSTRLASWRTLSRLRVISSATCEGTHSNTIEKQPSCSNVRA